MPLLNPDLAGVHKCLSALNFLQLACRPQQHAQEHAQERLKHAAHASRLCLSQLLPFLVHPSIMHRFEPRNTSAKEAAVSSFHVTIHEIMPDEIDHTHQIV